MKFECNKEDKELSWHPFYAIFPHQISEHECRWLEWIERRKVVIEGAFDIDIYGGMYSIYQTKWEYRAKP